MSRCFVLAPAITVPSTRRATKRIEQCTAEMGPPNGNYVLVTVPEVALGVLKSLVAARRLTRPGSYKHMYGAASCASPSARPPLALDV